MGIGAEGRPFASLPTLLMRSAVGCSLSRWRACVLAYRQQHNRESRMPFAIRVRVWTNDVPCLMRQSTHFPPSCPSAPKAFWGFLCVLFPLFAPHSSQTDGPGRMRRTDTPRHDTPSPPATATQWAHRPTTDEKDDDDNALCHLESKGAAQYSPAQPNPTHQKKSHQVERKNNKKNDKNRDKKGMIIMKEWTSEQKTKVGLPVNVVFNSMMQWDSNARLSAEPTAKVRAVGEVLDRLAVVGLVDRQ
ncbi:hypothetical protein HDK77DRAFT_174613 [Phyllosticta capitalensis]